MRATNNNPSCLPAVKHSAVGVLFSFPAGVMAVGVLLLKKVFLTGPGEGVGLALGL